MSNSRVRIGESTIIQRFDLQVTEAGQPVTEEFEVEAIADRLLGLLLTSDREDLLFYRGSQEITINNQEICPEGYESKLLMSGLNVSPNERFHEISLYVGNRQLDVKYKDTEHSKAPFEPYRVTVYVFLMENED